MVWDPRPRNAGQKHLSPVEWQHKLKRHLLYYTAMENKHRGHFNDIPRSVNTSIVHIKHVHNTYIENSPTSPLSNGTKNAKNSPIRPTASALARLVHPFRPTNGLEGRLNRVSGADPRQPPAQTNPRDRLALGK